MASTIVSNGVVKLTRGVHTNLGTIAATSQVVAFCISEPTRDNQGFLIITCVGTAGTTVTLEGSNDGGNTFFVMSSSATVVLNITGQLNGDPAVSAADAFQVAGMGSAVQFRYGFAAGTPNCQVWACYG